MYQFKKGAAAILAGVLSVSSVVPAFAAAPSDVENYDHVTTAGNKGNAAVMLTVEDREEPIIFSAYVPAELPIAIDANGDVVVPEDAKIINGVETLPIEVEAIDVTMEDGWTLASMSDDLTSETKDTKKVAMEVLGQDLSDATSFSPAKIEANGDIALNMKANLPDQSASSQTKIATIGFTVNWWEDQAVVTPQPGDSRILSKDQMDTVLESLTGSIVFSTEMYDPEQHTGTATDISEAQDGSVMAVVNGQDAVVYSEGGTLAPEDCSKLFSEYKATSMDLRGLDTSQTTDMSNMFYYSKATNLDLSGFNTSQVTNMSNMFYGATATSLDLASFDTSQVTNMANMFWTAQAKNIDVSTFDTALVTNMYAMFGYTAATSLDLSSFNTSNVTTMSNMFKNAAASKIIVSSFNTSQVKNMTGMFAETTINTLDLSSFDVANVEYINSMFDGSNISTVYCRTANDRTKMIESMSCSVSASNFVLKK